MYLEIKIEPRRIEDRKPRQAQLKVKNDKEKEEKDGKENALEKNQGPLTARDDNMNGRRSRVMEVLNVAYAGAIVDKRAASSAIREFEAMLDNLEHGSPRRDLVTLPRQEVENMKEVILYQEKKIRDLNERLEQNDSFNRRHIPLSNRDRPDRDRLDRDRSDRNRTDRDDQDRDRLERDRDRNRRIKLADQFNAIYDNEWRTAYTELILHMRWREVDVMYALMRVIRKACDMCIDMAEDQIGKLLVDMEHHIVDPLDRHAGQYRQISPKPERKPNSNGIKAAQRFANEYRKERAEGSVPAVIDIFMSTRLDNIIDPSQVREEFRRYIERCVELIWLMTTLSPPMRLYWLYEGDRVNPDLFHFYDRKGEYVKQTVFPAIFMNNTGHILHKGFVLAM